MDDVRPRAVTLMTLALVMTVALVAQTANLMVRERDRYSALAQRQLYSDEEFPAIRGDILDRSGVALATNKPANVVTVKYPEYKDEDLQRRLSELLEIPLDDLRPLVDRKLREGRHYEPLVIMKPITERQYAVLWERADEFRGVTTETLPLRSYPMKSLAAQVIGYLGPLSSDHQKLPRFRGYREDELVGQAGLEWQYESELRGQPGEKRIQISPGFEAVENLGVMSEPVPGNTLQLTLDTGLQRVAEEALANTMKQIQRTRDPRTGHLYRNARAGAAVVLDVHTGAVLAMASLPSYDLNTFVRRNSQEVKATLNAAGSPLINRAIAIPYYPGSSWKMVTLGAALTSGVVTPGERILASGTYKLTNQVDWRNHGWVNAVRALQVSSNIYFYEMGRRLGVDRMVEFARGYGFGQPTGVDLPGEHAGTLPDAKWRAEYAKNTGGWFLGHTTSVAIGQYVQATPLQLARYAAAIANGGKILRPYLVDAVLNPEGNVVRKNAPVVVGHLPITPQALEVIRRGMEAVTQPGGTSSFAAWPLPGIPTAGKTGSAQYGGKDPYGIYVAYAPAKDPQIAIAVVIEQAGSGSAVSPVARSIMAAYFDVPLPKEDPAWLPVLEPPASPERSGPGGTPR